MSKLLKLRRFKSSQITDIYINPDNVCDIIPWEYHQDVKCWIKMVNGEEHGICNPLTDVVSYFDLK